MALFRCVKCGCEEDTALCHYWLARLKEAPPLCSACDPKIGKWHGEFPRICDGSLRTLVEVAASKPDLTRLAEIGIEASVQLRLF
jgi:hypothetical protein